MRKVLLTLAVAGLSVGGAGAALADDYVADPREVSGGNGRCQEVGDPRAGDNDDNGLSVASTVSEVIRLAADDDECDNSGGRRP